MEDGFREYEYKKGNCLKHGKTIWKYIISITQIYVTQDFTIECWAYQSSDTSSFQDFWRIYNIITIII